MADERLQKIIARAGLASRREAEEMILAGRIRLNGKVVTELGTKADPDRDHIKLDGKLITRSEEPRYILLYKPKEVMTTVDDPEGRKTVMDLLRGVRERVFPVGRLDYHSEGLIVLTNDGELAYKLSHPSHGTIKTYHVKVRGVPSDKIIEKLARGIVLDGKRTRPAEFERLRTTGTGREEGNSWFVIRLQEGRTQQIRRMFQVVGHPVSKLKRVAIGSLQDGSLQPGQWRPLEPFEIRLLLKDEKPKARKAPRKRAVTKKAPASKGQAGRPARKSAPTTKRSSRTSAAAEAKRPSRSSAAAETKRSFRSSAAKEQKSPARRSAEETARPARSASRDSSRGARDTTARKKSPGAGTRRRG
ncbi:MAG: pseudouridine synthase [Thermoanaerobaculia bacterium]